MWKYNNEEFNETPEEYQGFVYEITELSTGKKYIGKKNFWSPKIIEGWQQFQSNYSKKIFPKIKL